MDARRILFILCDQKTAGAPFTPVVALKANGKKLKSLPMTNYDKDIWMAIANISADQCKDLAFCTCVSGGSLTTMQENWIGLDSRMLLQGDVIVRQRDRRSPPVMTPIAVQNMNMCFFNFAPKDKVSSAGTTDILGDAAGLGGWQPEYKPVAVHVAHGLSCVPVRIDETSIQFKLVLSLKWKTHVTDDSWTDWTTGLKWEAGPFQNKCADVLQDPTHIRVVSSRWGDNSVRVMDVPVHKLEAAPPAPTLNQHRLQRLRLIQEAVERFASLPEAVPTQQTVTSEDLQCSHPRMDRTAQAAEDVECTVSKKEEEHQPLPVSRRPGFAGRLRRFFRRVVSKRAV